MKNQKPKLYILHTHLLLKTGGSRFIFEVAKRLSQRYLVTLYCEQASKEWITSFAEYGVSVIPYLTTSSHSQMYWFFFPFYFLQNLFFLYKHIPRNAIVISFMFPMHTIAAMLNVRHVYYCFEPFAFFYDPSLKASFNYIQRVLLSFLKVFYSPLDKWGVIHADKVLAINPSVGHWIYRIYSRTPDRYTYLGVDTDFFKPQQIKKNEDEVVLFHSTDYTPLKGTELLLRALPQLTSKKWKLHISESVENSTIKEYYRVFLTNHNLLNKVSFLGHVPYARLPSYYTAADVFCFTGDPRSTGASAASLSVLEAQATGLPVIRSIGNTDEVIQGKTGLVVNTLDSKMLAKAIDMLVQSNHLRTALSANARKHILSRYTWDAVTTVVELTIKDLLYENKKK